MKSCEDFAATARDRITIESPTDTPGEYGGFERSWATVGSMWAVVTPVSGREVFAQQSLQTTITHKMLIRYQSDYAVPETISNYRVSLDGRYFAVKYSRNLGKDLKTYGRDFIEIYTEENAPDAATS